MKIHWLYAVALTVLASSGVGAAQGDPRVVLQTSMGDITLELDAVHAPASTRNFLHYVTEGRFDGIRFYRVVPPTIIQAGLFGGGGNRAPFDPIPLESSNGLSNVRGSVAMARSQDPNSGGSEFFINLDDNKNLDADPGDSENKTGYAVFGHVVGGLDVADRISAVPLGGEGPFAGNVPLDPVIVMKAVLIQP